MISVYVGAGINNRYTYNVCAGDCCCAISIKQNDSNRMVALLKAVDIMSTLFLTKYEIINAKSPFDITKKCEKTKPFYLKIPRKLNKNNEVQILVPSRRPNTDKVTISLLDVFVEDVCYFIKKIANLLGYNCIQERI